MDLMKKRWLILIASCFVTLCVGSLNAWSVFASPMSAYLSELSGKEIASLAIVFTVANSVGPIRARQSSMSDSRLPVSASEALWESIPDLPRRNSAENTTASTTASCSSALRWPVSSAR